MSSVLWFLACLAGIVLLGFVVSKLNGTKSHHLETFPLQSGERVLWEDLAADTSLRMATRALLVSQSRLRRNAVRVTNLRIIAGTRGLFGPNHVIEQVLYPSDRSYPEEANTLSGGFFKYGYKVLVFDRARSRSTSERGVAFFELVLSPALGSSTNLTSLRIYSDALQTLILPE